MVPDRILRDELLTSERYWQVSDSARLTYIHLLLSVDDTARFSGKNFTLRATCFPGRAVEPTDMERWLSELQDADLVRLYSVNGERFVFVPRFRQRLRFTNSRYPEPPKEINDLVSEKSDLSPTQASLKPDSRRQKRREEKRREEEKGTRFARAPLPAEWRAFCVKERPDLDPEQVYERFADYWVAVAGSKGVKKDWFATFRNWVRDSRPVVASQNRNQAPAADVFDGAR